LKLIFGIALENENENITNLVLETHGGIPFENERLSHALLWGCSQGHPNVLVIGCSLTASR